MCGILGIVSDQNNVEKNRPVLREMGRLQLHRGPDAWGEFHDAKISLGHNRLSILDLSLGIQPMSSFTGKHLIVYNGEIYNYGVLKEELLQLGVKFKTHNSDTEVIVNGFAIHGTDFFSKLEGMFAFCIYDIENAAVYLCRDSIGIKPLYYSVNNLKELVFASELKTIIFNKKQNNELVEVDEDLLPEYFHFRAASSEKTLVKNIVKLLPGHILKYDINDKNLQIIKYYTPNKKIAQFKSEVNCLESLENILSVSVKKHLISDVNLGVFLSGGVDSSLITHYASRLVKVDAFTLGTNSILDESKYAKIVADTTKSSINIKMLEGEEYLSEFGYWAYINDDPVSDPSALALMILSKHAKDNGFKVMLSGEGADELFAGYYSYQKYLLINIIKKAGKAGMPFLLGLFNKFPKLKDYQTVDYFLGTAHLTSFEAKKELFKDNNWLNEIKFNENYEDLGMVSNLRQACLADQFYRLPNDILPRTDRATMAYSIEARVPFLNTDIIDFANSLEDKYCLNLVKRNGKKILKTLATKHLPKEIIFRKKVGFDLPVAKWLEENFKDVLYEYYFEKKFQSLNYGYLLDIYQKGLNPGLIWAWLQLETWFRVHILTDKTSHPLYSSDSLLPDTYRV